MARNILVAYDGSDLSKKALQEAKKEVESNIETNLHLLSVVTQIGPASHHGVAQSIQREIADNLYNELKEVETEFTNDGLQVRTEVFVDDKQRNAGHKIIEYAQDNKIDIIMIGNRGLGNVKGIFLGSVSSQVIQHAPCHVYVIK